MPETYQGRRGEAGRFFPQPNEGVSPPRFGDFINRIGTITIPLDSARTRERIRIGGTFLWAFDATSLSAEAYLSFADDNADRGILFKKGVQVAGARFGSLYLTNTAQAGESISLAYSMEEGGAIRIENPGADLSSVTLLNPTGFSTIADVTVTSPAAVVVAANAARRSLLIVNGAQPIRLGDSNVTAARGIRLVAGASLTLSSTAALYGIREGATDSTISVLEETT